jgi:glucose/arabinose dehydrogenase
MRGPELLKRLTVFILLIFCMVNVHAQQLSPCGQRSFLVEFPRVISDLWCVERPLVADNMEWAFTSLAFTEDGSFYATRLATGQLLQLIDTDADRMPDQVEVVAEGLRLPNGLATEGNKVFILGDGVVYQYDSGNLKVIVDDLPGGRGFIAKGIATKDGRIYIGIPYPCDVCEVDNELYGTVLSMDTEGENREIVARGLRYPAGLVFHDGTLWVTDTARDGLSSREAFDEINQIDLAAEVPHFGFPNCVGLENQADWANDFDCSTATGPVWVLQAHANPLALDSYKGSAFPWLDGQLLISLGGSFDNSFIRGYVLVAVHELEDDRLENEVILPADPSLSSNQLYVSDSHFISVSSGELVNRRGAGIWPHRLYDAAISPEGWIYLAVGGEGVYVLRSGNLSVEEICDTVRDC